MDNSETRYANFALLAKSYKTDSEFADATGMSPSYVSQIRTKRRAIGVRNARKIESALGLPHGWMDQLNAGCKEQEAAQAVLAHQFSLPSLMVSIVEEIEQVADPIIRDEVKRLADTCIHFPEERSRALHIMSRLLHCDHPRAA